MVSHTYHTPGNRGGNHPQRIDFPIKYILELMSGRNHLLQVALCSLLLAYLSMVSTLPRHRTPKKENIFNYKEKWVWGWGVEVGLSELK
jgi:hypothetical protein